jgi:hypothetical protein
MKQRFKAKKAPIFKFTKDKIDERNQEEAEQIVQAVIDHDGILEKYTSEIKRRNIYFEHSNEERMRLTKSPIYEKGLMNRINQRSNSKVRYGREMKSYDLKKGEGLITNQLIKHEKEIIRDLKNLRKALREVKSPPVTDEPVPLETHTQMFGHLQTEDSRDKLNLTNISPIATTHLIA